MHVIPGTDIIIKGHTIFKIKINSIHLACFSVNVYSNMIRVFVFINKEQKFHC